MKKVILLCGVPGSGKTWIMKQISGKYGCVHNDEYIGKPRQTMIHAVLGMANYKTVVVDCPFGERDLKNQLESQGGSVFPLFIVEKPSVIKMRYESRESKPATQATLTRAHTILDRVMEWNSPYGTSTEVLKMLMDDTIG